MVKLEKDDYSTGWNLTETKLKVPFYNYIYPLLDLWSESSERKNILGQILITLVV